MDSDTKKIAIGVAAFAAGALCAGFISKHIFGDSENSDGKEAEGKKGKKVNFDPEVLQQEEVKEIINMTIKETMDKFNRESHIKTDKSKLTQKQRDSQSRRRYSENDEPIYKICFTGGPCAGKTTALSSLLSQCSQLGFKPFLVPEAATTLMKAGYLIDNSEFSELEAIQFQSSLMRLQIFLEDLTLEYAAATSSKPVVIFCDRGLMDGKAYVSDKVWQAIMDEFGWNEVYLRDSRYDAVIHMVTAADGAEKFYDLDTNEARYEDMKTAVEVDKKIQKNWSGHSQL